MKYNVTAWADLGQCIFLVIDSACFLSGLGIGYHVIIKRKIKISFPPKLGMWPGMPVLEGRNGLSFSKSKIYQGLAFLWKIRILFVWILGITKLKLKGKSKQILVVMAPSCHHCLLRWFCKVHTVAFTGHKWPKKIILGQARLFAIHVYLAQEWVVSYAKIQIYMLDRIKIIEETVIRKQINFLLCQPYQCGKA